MIFKNLIYSQLFKNGILQRGLHTSTVRQTKVELFYDIASTYTYLQLELLKRQQKIWPSMELFLTPVSIPFIMRQSTNSPPFVVPAKAKYLMKDFKLVFGYSNVPFGIREDFFKLIVDVGTYRTQRFLVAMQQHSIEDHDKLVAYFFQRFFSPDDPVNITDLEVVKKLSSEAGVSKDLIGKAWNDMGKDNVKQLLKDNIDRVVELGAFGLPVTLVHRTPNPEWVFGSDRLHIIGDLLGEKALPVLK